jgi:hypothetical protein
LRVEFILKQACKTCRALIKPSPVECLSNISKWPDRKLLLLNIDSGGVQSRRIIDRMLAQEHGTLESEHNASGAAV